MGNEGGLRPWVNFIWLPPDFRVIICDGNGIISPARETRFKYDHIFSHPTGEWPFSRDICRSPRTRNFVICSRHARAWHIHLSCCLCCFSGCITNTVVHGSLRICWWDSSLTTIGTTTNFKWRPKPAIRTISEATGTTAERNKAGYTAIQSRTVGQEL